MCILWYLGFVFESLLCVNCKDMGKKCVIQSWPNVLRVDQRLLEAVDVFLVCTNWRSGFNFCVYGLNLWVKV